MGFLFAGYEDEYVFWDALVLGRKALLSGAAVFLAHSGTTIQVVVAILILFICHALQMKYRPLEHDWHDWMEEHSLMASTFVLIICLIAIGGASDELDPVAKFLVSSAVFVITLLFFGHLCE